MSLEETEKRDTQKTDQELDQAPENSSVDVSSDPSRSELAKVEVRADGTSEDIEILEEVVEESQDSDTTADRVETVQTKGSRGQIQRRVRAARKHHRAEVKEDRQENKQERLSRIRQQNYLRILAVLRAKKAMLGGINEEEEEVTAMSITDEEITPKEAKQALENSDGFKAALKEYTEHLKVIAEKIEAKRDYPKGKPEEGKLFKTMAADKKAQRLMDTAKRAAKRIAAELDDKEHFDSISVEEAFFGKLSRTRDALKSRTAWLLAFVSGRDAEATAAPNEEQMMWLAEMMVQVGKVSAEYMQKELGYEFISEQEVIDEFNLQPDGGLARNLLLPISMEFMIRRAEDAGISKDELLAEARSLQGITPRPDVSSSELEAYYN